MELLALFGQSLLEVGRFLLAAGGAIVWFIWFLLLPSQMPLLTLWFLLFLGEGRLSLKTPQRERIAKVMLVLIIVILLVVYLAAFHATRIYFEYNLLGMASAANNPAGLETTAAILIVTGIVGAVADLVIGSWLLTAGRGY